MCHTLMPYQDCSICCSTHNPPTTCMLVYNVCSVYISVSCWASPPIRAHSYMYMYNVYMYMQPQPRASLPDGPQGIPTEWKYAFHYPPQEGDAVSTGDPLNQN